MGIPTHIFGFPARPVRELSERVIARASFPGVDVLVLRWERPDFHVDALKSSDGWFVSMRVTDQTGSFDLLQFRTPFFVSEPIAGLKGVGIPVLQGDGFVSPKWHKSSRTWPILGEKKASFVGQFYYDHTVAYIFRLPIDSSIRYVIFKDDLDSQDVEDHYQNEACKASNL